MSILLQTPVLDPPLSSAAPDREAVARRIAELGEWFHNLELHGVSTAPNHFLGDFPSIKWKHIAGLIPEDISGTTVLDVGCNAGFYSLAMKRRGAGRVVAIDVDDRYLEQARFAAGTLRLDIEFEKRSVYFADQLPGQFDYVFFMGLLYHLRYPLYALDTVVQKVKPGGKLIFQTMVRGSEETPEWQKNYHFWEKDIFADPRFPAMYFIEHGYAGDPTNWWIPNAGAAEAMLRSSGLEIVAHPEPETWICAPVNTLRDGRPIRELELDGTL